MPDSERDAWIDYFSTAKFYDARLIVSSRLPAVRNIRRDQQVASAFLLLGRVKAEPGIGSGPSRDEDVVRYLVSRLMCHPIALLQPYRPVIDFVRSQRLGEVETRPFQAVPINHPTAPHPVGSKQSAIHIVDHFVGGQIIGDVGIFRRRLRPAW